MPVAAELSAASACHSWTLHDLEEMYTCVYIYIYTQSISIYYMFLKIIFFGIPLKFQPLVQTMFETPSEKKHIDSKPSEYLIVTVTLNRSNKKNIIRETFRSHTQRSNVGCIPVGKGYSFTPETSTVIWQAPLRFSSWRVSKFQLALTVYIPSGNLLRSSWKRLINSWFTLWWTNIAIENGHL